MRAIARLSGRVALPLGVVVLATACGADRERGQAAGAAPPATRTAPVTDTYHGVAVADDYRWLEDWSSPEVQAWSEAQNAHARAVLDALPGREAIGARVRELRTDRAESYYALRAAGNRIFAMKRQPPKQQPLLVVLPSLDNPAGATVVLDPEVIDPTHSTTIDFFEPSPDGSLVAVSLSSGGSESGHVHIFDVSGRPRGEVIPRVQGGTAAGDVAWTPDGSGFYYTRYPHEGERPAEDLLFYQQVYFHQLGADPKTDRYEIGRDFIKVAEIKIETHPSTPHVLVSVQLGDGGGWEHHLRGPDGRWQRLTSVTDRIAKMSFGADRDLILVSRSGAPRGQLLRVPLASPRLDRARTIVPESDLVIESDFWEIGPSPVVTRAGIFVPYQAGGPMEVKAFGPDGAPRGRPELPPLSGVYEMTAIGDDLALEAASYTSSTAWYRFSPGDGRTVRTPLIEPAPVSFDDAEVVRKFATSTDGTQVPYVIIRPKGAAGRNIPMVVTGYGGYGNSLTPSFNRMNRLLLDRGVGMVQTFLRGGGEFGEAWHENGRLTRKQNVFDDFAAVLRQLAADGDSSPERLGIIGGSNGGLLMGATFTQHPELARAVVSVVGIYDMLRSEQSPNGTFNIPEFGTVADAAQFAALHAYSPYHHVRDGATYPSILFMTGANDPRVDPMHSRKMTARLQASGTARPVLLRTSGNTGHGAGTPLDARIEEDTDTYSFLFNELGVR